MNTETKTKIKMPPHVDTIRETIVHGKSGDKLVTVEINHDSGSPNPCTDWDGTGHIRSFYTRHINNIGIEEALRLLSEDEDVVPLAYFEHGRSLWMVKGGPYPGGVEFQWDGREFAGIWIPDHCVRESFTGQDGKSRHEWMVDQARSACEIYSQWINGDIYTYTVKLYQHVAGYDSADDYGAKDVLKEDSCGGFYGWKTVLEEAASAAEGLL